MGAIFSAFFGEENRSRPSSEKLQLGDLPESCVASILSNLDPPEICKFARLNRAFRGGSWADFVWESKLPSNYQVLVRKLLGDVPVDLGKKEIYARLCQPRALDGGIKRVWLDKSTSGVCLSISSKGLAITGIEDRRYWKYIPTKESRFNSVAYLQQIWWFEVEGEVEFPFPPGTYSLFFRVQLGQPSRRFGRQICNTDHVHGWDLKPVQFRLRTSDGQHSTTQSHLNNRGKWEFYHVGDFVVDNSNESMKIKFSMAQIDCTHTKGGVCLDSALIFPKHAKGSMFLDQN